MNREPYAYWKGNPTVAETRQDLLKCNVTEQQEWNARLYAQVGIQSHLLLTFVSNIHKFQNCSFEFSC